MTVTVEARFVQVYPAEVGQGLENAGIEDEPGVPGQVEGDEVGRTSQGPGTHPGKAWVVRKVKV